MTDGAAEGGVISKEIKRIFQRVREIIDESLEALWPGQEEGRIV